MSNEGFIFITNSEENIEKSQKLSTEYIEVDSELLFLSAT